MTRPNGPHDGIPVRWSVSEPSRLPILPTDEAWFKIEDRPDYDPETARIERVLDETLLIDGWRVVDLTPEEIAQRNRPKPITKLTIKRRLEALGKWETFKAILAQSPESVQDEWTLAQEIRADDPMFSANKESFRLALGLTEQQFNELLTTE
jgi:hypothetical protein